MSPSLPDPWENDDSAVRAALQGLLSGGLGTVPMTAAMAAIKQFLPAGQQYPLPPRMIVEDISEEMDFDDVLSTEEKETLTWVSHFGYGSLLGAVYGLLARRSPLQGIGGGMAFGLAVWCGSYLGWLPALNMRASATKEPAQRNAMMIAAHLIWGGVTGLLHEAQQAEGKPHRG